MARSEAGDRRARWYGRVFGFVTLTGHIEESDAVWELVKNDIGACTQAYLNKDVEGWSLHLARIRLRLNRQKDSIENSPTWC